MISVICITPIPLLVRHRYRSWASCLSTPASRTNRFNLDGSGKFCDARASRAGPNWDSFIAGSRAEVKELSVSSTFLVRCGNFSFTTSKREESLQRLLRSRIIRLSNSSDPNPRASKEGSDWPEHWPDRIHWPPTRPYKHWPDYPWCLIGLHRHEFTFSSVELMSISRPACKLTSAAGSESTY